MRERRSQKPTVETKVEEHIVPVIPGLLVKGSWEGPEHWRMSSATAEPVEDPKTGEIIKGAFMLGDLPVSYISGGKARIYMGEEAAIDSDDDRATLDVWPDTTIANRRDANNLVWGRVMEKAGDGGDTKDPRPEPEGRYPDTGMGRRDTN